MLSTIVLSTKNPATLVVGGSDDKELNRSYEALSCINDDLMAKRCMNDDAPKVIYSIKANAQLNSEMHITVRDGLKRGKLRLLMSENEAKEQLGKIKGYYDLPVEQQVELLAPYMQTTLLVNEMINLERIDNDGLVKLKEPSTKRKDRYSSLGYGVYVAKELEGKLRKQEDNTDWSDMPSLCSEIYFTL